MIANWFFGKTVEILLLNLNIDKGILMIIIFLI
jgi:hypothetical protein